MSYKHDVFLSYKWREECEEWINKIFHPIVCEHLDANLPTTWDVFKDTEDIQYGSALPQSIKKALGASKCMIAVVNISYFSKSLWCPTELSVMKYRESQLGLRSMQDPRGLIFPVIFYTNKPGQKLPHIPLYKYQQVGDLIRNFSPLELDKNKYLYTNKAFLESDEYNELKEKIRLWLDNGVLDLIQNPPAWSADWSSEKWLDEPYKDFKNLIDQSFHITQPKL